MFDNCMKRRLIPVLPAASLQTMLTKQLLGRLRSLQRCEESAALSDRTGEITASDGILFKDTAEWQRAYGDLKAVLTRREHVPSADERTKTRRERAHLRLEGKSNQTLQATAAKPRS
jgi:hypothetical protein